MAGAVHLSRSTWRQPWPPAANSARQPVLRAIAARILSLGDRRVRVAIDGRTAAGKTTLGHEVAQLLADDGRVVLRAFLDDFKRPWAESHLYDRTTGDGYYRNEVDPERSVRRGTRRDAEREGARQAEALHRERNRIAEDIDIAEADPLARADVVVDNNDLDRPRLLRG